MTDAQALQNAAQAQTSGSQKAPAKSKPAERISLDEAKDALLRSGYLLESRLETALSRKGYYVEANEAYPDPESGKTREFDLYAISAHRAGPDRYDFIFQVLLVECINNLQPVAFLSKNPQAGFLHQQEIKMAGLPVKIPERKRRDEWESLADFLDMSKYHHYCKGRIATQFCSFVRKRNSSEWMATHEEEHFDALRKLCAVTEHAVNQNFANWTIGAKERINIEFYYPVVVLQGDLFEARTEGKSVKLLQSEHIQFRRSTITGKEQQTFQIDVVTEKHFSRYLQVIEKEMEKTARLLRRRHMKVEDAIRQIVQRGRRLRSPDKIKKLLEF
jgi:hypothetical protein